MTTTHHASADVGFSMTASAKCLRSDATAAGTGLPTAPVTAGRTYCCSCESQERLPVVRSSCMLARSCQSAFVQRSEAERMRCCACSHGIGRHCQRLPQEAVQLMASRLVSCRKRKFKCSQKVKAAAWWPRSAVRIQPCAAACEAVCCCALVWD